MQVCRKLSERKLANTATSIVLGSDLPSYESDAASRQKDVLLARLGDRVDCTAMKKALTTTHFELGDERLDYGTESTQHDTTGRLSEFTAKSAALDQRKSSCFFGNEDVRYVNAASDAVDSERVTAAARDDKMRVAARRLKSELSRHSFSLGSENTAYETTARRAFGYDEAAFRAARGKLNSAQMTELRREHFELGSVATPVVYETDAWRSGDITPARVDEMRRDASNAKELKTKLLATSVVIGDDPDFLA